MRLSLDRVLALTATIAWALGAAAPAPASQAAGTGGRESAEVEKVIRASIGWALTKDRETLLDAVAQDAGFFIFHPDSASTVAGFEAFRKMVDEVFMDPRFKATDFAVRDLRIQFSRANDVAWYSAFLDDHGTFDGKPTGWDDARWTGVLEKRDGKWVLVQMHFSLAQNPLSLEPIRKERGGRPGRSP